MSLFNFSWRAVDTHPPECQHTMGDLSIQIGQTHLTENDDIWSKSVRKDVLVSAYPLALWLAASWWRLCYEPLPQAQAQCLTDWRMSHELTAANQGFIWPRLIFASDTTHMHIWAPPHTQVVNQSVRYLNYLPQPATLPLDDFKHEVDTLIHAVLSRLEAMGHPTSELHLLWQEVLAERTDPALSEWRQREAELGFDPGEAPDALIEQALDFAQRIGPQTFSEIMPSYSQVERENPTPFDGLQTLLSAPGILGHPAHIPLSPQTQAPSLLPWQQANALAQALRAHLGIHAEQRISDTQLYDLLGFTQRAIDNFSAPKGQTLALATPRDDHQHQFYIRKNHPLARRFELARLLGDHLHYGHREQHWLASSETRTARQKFQRAFAAEFLLPFSGLLAFTERDFSETALEDAAAHFQVSEKTVETVLMNHNLLAQQAQVNVNLACPY